MVTGQQECVFLQNYKSEDHKLPQSAAKALSVISRSPPIGTIEL